MSRKIIGVTVGSPLPKPNLMQNDPYKGDYVKGKEEFLKQVNHGATDEQIAAGSLLASRNQIQILGDVVSSHYDFDTHLL